MFDLGVGEAEFNDSHYRSVLQQAHGQAFELMVHPVTDAGAMEGYTRIGATGKSEYDYLVRGALPALALEEGFTLGSYRNLAR